MTPELLDEKNETPVSTGEDDVRQFLSEIRAYPRLSPEEEKALAKRCSEGDEAAIRQMVNSNLRLVVSVAREYAGRGVPLLDLIQEGSIGLLVAARKFDYTLDFRFSTYATKWIRQGVTRCLMNQSGAIRVPVHTAERMHKIDSVRASLLSELGREPTNAEIAEKTGFSEAKVAQFRRLSPEVCSLDVPTGEDDDGTLHTLLKDVQSPQPQEELVRRELENMMERLLGALNDRQRQVLRLRFGMEDGKCHSLEDIGTRLGVSKERVRQIEKQAMTNLKVMGADMGLEDFLE